MKMNKKTRKAYAYGSMVRKPMQEGGMMSSAMMNPMEQRQQKGMQPAMGMPKMAGGGNLKAPPNPGAAALPKKVRNNMGFYAYGGKAKSKYTG